MRRLIAESNKSDQVGSRCLQAAIVSAGESDDAQAAHDAGWEILAGAFRGLRG